MKTLDCLSIKMHFFMLLERLSITPSRLQKRNFFFKIPISNINAVAENLFFFSESHPLRHEKHINLFCLGSSFSATRRCRVCFSGMSLTAFSKVRKYNKVCLAFFYVFFFFDAKRDSFFFRTLDSAVKGYGRLLPYLTTRWIQKDSLKI